MSAEAPLIEVARSDVTSTVPQRTIDALPLNGRNFTDLIALVPGAKPDPNLTHRRQHRDLRRAGRRGVVSGRRRREQRPGQRRRAAPLHAGLDQGVRGHHDRLRSRVRPRAGRRREHRDALGDRTAWTAARSGSSRNDKLDSNNIPAPSPLPAGYVTPERAEARTLPVGRHPRRTDRQGPGVLLRLVREAERERAASTSISRRSRPSCSRASPRRRTSRTSASRRRTIGFTGMVKADVNLSRATG